MVWQNNLREIRKVIYHLKMRYGLTLEYFDPTGQTHDPKTGAITRQFTQITINRAVILPTDLSRSFIYDLAYIASNKNFTEGGFFDKNLKKIIIDKEDFPQDFLPDVNHHMEFDGGRYEILSIQIFEDRRAYLFNVEGILNSPTVI